MKLGQVLSGSWIGLKEWRRKHMADPVFFLKILLYILLAYFHLLIIFQKKTTILDLQDNKYLRVGMVLIAYNFNGTLAIC